MYAITLTFLAIYFILVITSKFKPFLGNFSSMFKFY